MTYRIGSLCTGYGGLDSGVMAVLGGELVFVADNDPGAAQILAHRFPAVPNLGDITDVDWSTLEPADVLCTGFPCQDVSCAGARKGLREGTRTGVWAHVARAIEALRPSLVVLENVRGLLSAGADSPVESCPWCMGEADLEHALRAAGAILGDLASLGLNAEWVVVSAADAGAPHLRERVFILAWPAADTERLPVQRRRGSEVLGSPEQAAAGNVVKREAPERERQWDGDAAADRHQAASEDPNRTAGGEWRLPAPGQAPGGRAWADTGGSGGAPAAADAMGDGRHEGWPEPAGIVGRPDAAERSDGSPADTESDTGRLGNGDYVLPRWRADGRGQVAGGGTPADAERGGCDRGASLPLRSEAGRTTAAWNSGSASSHPTTPDTDSAGQGGLELPSRGRQPGRRFAGGCEVPADAECDGLQGYRPATRAGTRRPDSPSVGCGPDSDFTAVQWGAYEPAIRRWESILGRPAPNPTEPGRTGQRLSPRFVEWMMGLPGGWVTSVPGLSRNAQLKALGNGVVPQQAILALSLLLPSWAREVAA